MTENFYANLNDLKRFALGAFEVERVYKWASHEEKETDVNIASYLIDLAYQNAFDRALIISNDSDLGPAIRLTRKRFPNKRITTIAPPNYYHSNELIQASSDKARIRIEHLEQALFPSMVENDSGIIINCPKEYTAEAAFLIHS